MSWKASAWAKQQRLGSPAAKSILMCLADYADPNGLINGWASQAQLADDAEVSERSVREWMQRLEDMGLMERRRQSRPNGARAADIIQLYLSKTISASGTETGVEERDSATDLPADSAGRAYRQPDADLPADGDSPTGTEFRAHKEEPPISTQSPPSERERGREDGQEEEASPETHQPEDNPTTAAFQKRVMRFCSGRGFQTGAWPDWDQSSPGWIGKQFASLSPTERGEAERWRDPYLLDFRDRKGKPMKVGIFLRDKAWTGLEPELLGRFDKWQQAKLGAEERSKPDGWAACRGPVGKAWVFGALLGGPTDDAAARELAASSTCRDPQLERVWPKLMQWRAVLRQAGGIVFAERWHALKDAMEPVPAGTDVLAAWKAEFERRGWPWLVEFDHGDVVYCPKGGPDGLSEFEQALARIGAETEGKNGDDDGQRQAAE
jgi:DNA-binding transcriptional ArsR family regulator